MPPPAAAAELGGTRGATAEATRPAMRLIRSRPATNPGLPPPVITDAMVPMPHLATTCPGICHTASYRRLRILRSFAMCRFAAGDPFLNRAPATARRLRRRAGADFAAALRRFALRRPPRAPLVFAAARDQRACVAGVCWPNETKPPGGTTRETFIDAAPVCRQLGRLGA